MTNNMPAYEQMIEAGARATFKEYYPHGYGETVTSYDDAPESHKANLRRCSKAALDAFLALLPESDMRQWAILYGKLLDMRKK